MKRTGNSSRSVEIAAAVAVGIGGRKVHAVFKGEVLQALNVSILDCNTLCLSRDTCIARCAIDLSYLRRAAESVNDRMLTSTATDYQYFLHIYVCYIYNVSLVFKLLVYTM